MNFYIFLSLTVPSIILGEYMFFTAPDLGYTIFSEALHFLIFFTPTLFLFGITDLIDYIKKDNKKGDA